jgi:hypothetical protein
MKPNHPVSKSLDMERQQVTYRPYNISDYKNSFVSDRYRALGGLGPSVTDVWSEKKGLYEKRA